MTWNTTGPFSKMKNKPKDQAVVRFVANLTGCKPDRQAVKNYLSHCTGYDVRIHNTRFSVVSDALKYTPSTELRKIIDDMEGDVDTIMVVSDNQLPGTDSLFLVLAFPDGGALSALESLLDNIKVKSRQLRVIVCESEKDSSRAVLVRMKGLIPPCRIP